MPDHAHMLEVVCNGEPLSLPEGCTIAHLVMQRGLERLPCAVEVNRTVVPRRRHADTPLHDGDRVEIVTLVGGG